MFLEFLYLLRKSPKDIYVIIELIAKLFKFSSLFFLRGVSEISDDEWKLIKSLLSPRISRPSVDDMLVERYSIRTYYWYRWICLLIMTLLNFRRLKRWRS